MKDEMPKVSVIIPVYGVERYIERCVRSLFEQTLDDIEYLFIDDCTQDKSIEILTQVLEEYPNRRQQVKILHHDCNKGLPQARRTGIQVATGEYIGHCDSDDWVAPNMYELLFNAAQVNEADVVICDFNKKDGLKERIKKGCHSIDKTRFVEEMIYKRSSWAVWNKLYKRTLHSIDFQYPHDSMGEDMAMVIQLVCRSKRIAYIPKCLYNYCIHSESMVRQKTKSTCINQFYQQKNNIDIVLRALSSSDGLQIHPGYDKFLLFMASVNLTPLAYHDKDVLMRWRDLCPKMGKNFFFNPKIKLDRKLKYIRLSLLYFIQKNVS